MATRVLLGIDLGTSGVKAVAIGLDGAILAEAARDHPVHSPRAGWAESRPGDWWDAAVAAVAEVLAAGPYEVAGIGVDGQMHGLVLTGADGVPVRPALLWADSRATGELAAWEGLPADARARLANPLVPGMTGPLLSWVRRHEPETYARARVALLPKDWLRYRLTGAFATDPSDASATLLWDVPGDRWSQEAAAAAHVDPGLLPPVLPSGACAGELACALGPVRPGVPVAVGAADTAAALLATGLAVPDGGGYGDVQITVGTGAQIVRPVHRPRAADRPRTHLYRAAASDSWYAMAAVQNAGLALGWVRRVLGLTWQELYEADDAGGVTFVPYLTGERSPVLSTRARGAWLGLDLAAGRAQLARAAVEGVAFSIRHALEALPGPAPAHARVTGGGVTHPAFRRLLAGVLGIPLQPITVRSASAVGAALLAANAAALPPPRPPVTAEPPIRPVSGDHEAAYARYREHAERLAGRSPAPGTDHRGPQDHTVP